MKVLLMISVTCFSVIAAAQGTVNFANLASFGAVNAPVYQSDGVTKLSGPQYMAELLAGPTATELSPVATTSFLTGASAGYFLAGVQNIAGVQPGSTAWVAVEVWNTASGSSFDLAQASGLPNSWWKSSLFSVVLGDPSALGGPGTPANLTGLGTSPVFLNGVVPEPSSLALAGLGLATLVVGLRLRLKASGISGSQKYGVMSTR